MKTIELTRGMTALVDDEDFASLSCRSWHAIKDRRTYYAGSSQKEGDRIVKYVMHRIILGLTDPKQLVDHINRNGLDNRRQNLRIATKGQNAANCVKAKLPKATSRYKGISKQKNGKGWMALITVAQTKKYLGSFLTEEEAARAYDVAALQYFGQFAYLNFPLTQTTV